MIEINGTYYAKDTIKSISTAFDNAKGIDNYHLLIKIFDGIDSTSKWLTFGTQEERAHSRKQLIEQLNK